MPYRILLVETDIALAMRLTAALGQAGFAVVRAEGFEDALTRLRQARFELLITAVRLGPYNGLHLILRARGEQPRLPAVITSSAHDPLVEADAESMGAEYLPSPATDPAALLEVIALLLGAEPI